jgi:hypothetical protein
MALKLTWFEWRSVLGITSFGSLVGQSAAFMVDSEAAPGIYS